MACFCGAVCSLAGVSRAQTDTIHWRANGGAWETPANWSHWVPTADYNAVFDRGIAHTVSISSSAVASSTTLRSGDVTINLAASASLTGPVYVASPVTPAKLTLSLAPGAFVRGPIRVGHGNGASGALVLGGGTLTDAVFLGTQDGRGSFTVSGPGSQFGTAGVGSPLHISGRSSAVAEQRSTARFDAGTRAYTSTTAVGGSGGEGVLQVEDPGTEFHARDLLIGDDHYSPLDGPRGWVTVRGGAALHVSSELDVGEAGGTGHLTLSGPGTSASVRQMRVGVFAATVDGGPSIVPSQGTCTLDDRAALAATDFVYVGAAGGVGTMHLRAGSTLAAPMIHAGSGTSTVIGATYGGDGTIVVDGATITAGALAIGLDGPSRGTVTVRGAGTRLDVSGNLGVGGFSGQPFAPGTGDLHVDGGTVTVGGQLQVQPRGTVHYNGGVLRPEAVDVRGGRILLAAGSGTTLRTTALSLTDGSAVDLADNAAVVDYPAGSPALPQLLPHVKSGYAGGAWDGPGIRSSTAAAGPPLALGVAEASAVFTTFPADFQGETVDATSVLIRQTLYGDANLDARVNGSDFALLAGNFGRTGQFWFGGDFNYDGSVNGTDFALLAGNFGRTLSGAAAAEVTASDREALAAFASAAGVTVPEPCHLFALCLTAAGLLRRRGPRRNA